MKKNKPIKKNTTYPLNEATSYVNEPLAPYYTNVKLIPFTKEFTFKEFKKIADKAPFSLAEWAVLLHLSERTLQRYAKNNAHFAPIHAERALQIAKVLNEGIITFGDANLFYSWLKRNPYMLEDNLSLGCLTTFEGIQKVLTQLGRIQHGIFA